MSIPNAVPGRCELLRLRGVRSIVVSSVRARRFGIVGADASSTLRIFGGEI
jgi:hypothetical protein